MRGVDPTNFRGFICALRALSRVVYKPHLHDNALKTIFSRMSSIAVTRHRDVYPAIAPSTYTKSEFAGKIILITGGGNGLGKAAGLAFAQLGSDVCFADIIEEDALSAAKEATERFEVKAIGVQMNVTKLEDNERLVKTVERELGEVDCVIFSAVKARWDTLEISTSEDWWSVMETNLRGPVDLTRLVLPSMLKRNTGTLIYHASRVSSNSVYSVSSMSFSWRGLIIGRDDGFSLDSGVCGFQSSVDKIRGKYASRSQRHESPLLLHTPRICSL